MPVQDSSVVPFLIVQAGLHRCALPLRIVVETLRPLETRPIAHAPFFVTGAAVIRGEPLPVVDLSAFVGRATSRPTRFVVVRAWPHRVALAVDSVVGIRSLPPGALANVPPLLSGARADAVATLGVLDHDLLLSLGTAHLVPNEIWASLVDAGAT